MLQKGAGMKEEKAMEEKYFSDNSQNPPYSLFAKLIVSHKSAAGHKGCDDRFLHFHIG